VRLELRVFPEEASMKIKPFGSIYKIEPTGDLVWRFNDVRGRYFELLRSFVLTSRLAASKPKGFKRGRIEPTRARDDIFLFFDTLAVLDSHASSENGKSGWEWQGVRK